MQRRRLSNEMSERAHVAGERAETGIRCLRKKPMDWLLNEANASGEHTLKRTLGPYRSPRSASARSSARASSFCRGWERTTPGPA